MGDVSMVGLDLLRSFQAIYQAGTLTAAAQALELSQPAVTAHLQSLEAAAGRPLFVRGPRGCTPTPSGEELAARLAGPLAELAAVSAWLGDSPKLRDVTLRLAGPAEFTELCLAPALSDLVATGMKVHMEFGLAAELLDGLSRGHHDVVVSTIRPPATMVWAPLVDEEFVLVAAPEVADRVDAGAVTVDPVRALTGIPVIAYAQNQPIVRRWWRHVFGRRPAPGPQLVAPDLRTIRAAAVAGAGITVLPTYLCHAELAEGTLVELLRAQDGPINTLYIATTARLRHQRHITICWDGLVGAGRAAGRGLGPV